MVSNLALFYLATYLATFQKIGQFFPNHLVTLLINQISLRQHLFYYTCLNLLTLSSLHDWPTGHSNLNIKMRILVGNVETFVSKIDKLVKKIVKGSFVN
jgi:hypothetical protein